MQEIFGFGAVIAVLASLIAFWKLQTTTPSPPGDEETDSTEVSPSEVTPAPSRFTSVGTRMTPSASKTDLGCLVLTVILFVLAYLWFNSWLKEQKRKSDARKREFQNGVKKWMRLFKGGG